MKAKWVSIGLICTLSVSILSGCGDKAETGTNVAALAKETKAVSVNIEEAKEGTIAGGDTILAEISAKTSVEVVSKLSGKLVSLSVKRGDTVKKGQVIGTLEQTDYVLGVKQAEAALNSANASMSQAKAAVNTANATLSQATSTYGVKEAGQTSLQLAKQSVDIAQVNYDRLKSLYDAGAVSQSQLEQAESAVIQAKNLLNQMAQADAQGKAAITTAKSSVEQTKVSADKIAKAAVGQAQVGVEKARSALRDTVITSPIDGTVTSVGYETGELVSPQKAVASIIAIHPVIVKLNVSETAIAKYKQGAALDVQIPALSRTVKGKLTYVGLEADRQSKMFPIELEIENPDSDILPGMKVNVLGNNVGDKKGLLVPVDSIIQDNDKKFVYIVEGDKAVKREIVSSEGDSNHVVVMNGLKAGDKVVTKGQSQLKDQAKVRIIK